MSEGIEVRSLDILEEDLEDCSAIECTLSLPHNYNIDSFLDILKENLNLRRSKEKSK